MGTIKLTLHGSQLRGVKLSLAEKVVLAARYGYEGVDFSLGEAVAHGSPDAVSALLAGAGVAPSTAGGVLGADLYAEDDAFAAALAQVHQKALQAAAYGAARTGTVLRARAMRPRDELWPVVIERLRQVDRRLAGTGVRLGMEFLGVKTLHTERPYAFVGSMAEANDLLDTAGVEHVGLTLDSYHWYAANDTLDTIRRTPASRIVLLHINDARDLPRDELLDADRLVPGEGVIPLVDWLRAVIATGFDGFAGMEVLGPRLADVPAERCAQLGAEVVRPLVVAAAG